MVSFITRLLSQGCHLYDRGNISFLFHCKRPVINYREGGLKSGWVGGEGGASEVLAMVKGVTNSFGVVLTWELGV